MASNQSTIADQDGEYDDWIELYNNSSTPVSLSGWFLSDKADNLDKWDFPADASIAANGYLIVWADEDSSQVGLHANFKLSAAGEQLLLINASGNIVQDITFGTQQADKGYARSPNGTGSFVIKNPTFKANNDTGISASNDRNQHTYQLEVFPNPATHTGVVLKSNAPTPLPVSIFNSQGHLIGTTTLLGEAKIETANLPAGQYWIKADEVYKPLIINN